MLTDVAGDITSVSSPNRTIPAALRRYLETTYPVCGVEGCDETFGLQIDHIVDYGDVHETTQDNTWRICKHHHDLKTYFGWTVTGSTGHWNLVPPDDWTDDPAPTRVAVILTSRVGSFASAPR